MNTKILIAVFGAGLGLALALPAAAEKGKGPCAEDAAKFCKDVKPGEGRVAACLKEHEKELSQACKDRKALAAERKANRGGAWKRGNRGGGTCLREYGQGFASGFQRGFKMRGGQGRGAKAARGGGLKVCAADAKKLCEGVNPGEGRILGCLVKKADKLSEGCKARVEKFNAKKS